MPWLKQGINAFIPSVIWQPQPQIPVTLAEMSIAGIILDIGAGGRKISDRVWGVDFVPFPNTKLTADIHNLPLASECVCGVFCTGTLEHVNDPCQAMNEICRVMKVGGIIHLEVPFMQPFHSDPADYWRWTLDGLRLMVRRHGLQEIRSGAHLRQTSAMNALIVSYFQSWFSRRYIRKGLDVVLSFVLWPFKHLDYFASGKSKDVASAFYLVARKG